MLVPPVIEIVPVEAVTAAAPVYVVFGLTSTDVPDVAPPRTIDVVVEVAVTVPVVAVTAADVESSVWAVSETSTGADSAAEIVTVEAVEVIAMLPAVVVSEAPVFVKAADPENVISPEALIGPVGAIEVPPVMRTVPAEAVTEPDP